MGTGLANAEVVDLELNRNTHFLVAATHGRGAWGILTAPSPPAAAISSVNIAGSPASAGIVQNGWIEIRGANLVPPTTPSAGVTWSSAPDFAQGKLPTQIGGVSVTVNGKPAYVYFYCSAATSSVCATVQINALTPLDSTTGNVPVVVTSAGASGGPESSTLTLAVLHTVVPSFLLFNSQGYVAATHANGTLIGPVSLYPGASTPAGARETVVAYAVGFGLPRQAITAGSSTQSGTLATLPVCTINGNPATVTFAGLISPGLYQLNLAVPANTPSGDNPIACKYSGATTQSGSLLTVQ
jgi:uncharacterized protein (TIGR03437 family)